MQDKNIVMAVHGTGETTEYITIQIFKSAKAAYLYVENTAADNGDRWVRCEFIDEWKKYRLQRAEDTEERFNTEIPCLDDRSMQILLREIDSVGCAKAFNGMDTKVQDKLLRNVSKKAGGVMKKLMGQMQASDRLKAQRIILNTLDRLIEEGDIIPPYGHEAGSIIV